MKKIAFLSITVLLCLCSCKKETAQKPVEKSEEKPVLKKDTIVPDEIKPSLLDNDVDVKEVLSQIDDFTSGFMPKTQIQIYPANKKNKYFVHYTLIKYTPETDDERAGKLVVYDTVNPQYYGAGIEDFMDIYLSNKSLSIYNGSVKVGMTYKDVLEKFGDDFIRIDSTLIFKSGNRRAFFKIKDSTVTKIRIGNYRNNLDATEILNSHLW